MFLVVILAYFYKRPEALIQIEEYAEEKPNS
jgi:hypothetical protein